ncbi:hypothetical protein ILUMI_15316, partial [Ignelater luminosus]
VPLNSVIELILIDKGFAFDANHPFHLHGHSFRVVGMERIGKNVTEEEIRKLDEEGLIKRNLVNPPVKDTITVPDGGYTILRFHASNPGYWLFHCHIEFHIEIGMALVFKIGEHDEMLPVPPNFPKCGNYMPDYHATVNSSLCSEDNGTLSEIKHWFTGHECNSSGHITLQYYSILVTLLLLMTNYCTFR